MREGASRIVSGGLSGSAMRESSSFTAVRPISSTGLAQRYLQGTLDEPALYTSALSAATVLAHYEAGKP